MPACPLRFCEETVAALNIGARLKISRVNRSGISATKVDVIEDAGRKEMSAARAAHRLSHRHEHEHEATVHRAWSTQTATAPHAYHPHRMVAGLKKIREIIRASEISESAKKTAIAIFEALGEAEAKIHNMDIEKIHFHEVGAVDAMVDIVCAAVGAEALGVDEIVCSPLNVGGGTVKCAHGTFPVPAPATVELLKDAPVYSSGIQAELVTPTGAAIVKMLA